MIVSGCESQGSESGAGVRAIAERLPLTAPAGAPEISPPELQCDGAGAWLNERGVRLAHGVLWASRIPKNASSLKLLAGYYDFSQVCRKGNGRLLPALPVATARVELARQGPTRARSQFPPATRTFFSPGGLLPEVLKARFLAFPVTALPLNLFRPLYDSCLRCLATVPRCRRAPTLKEPV